MSWADAERFWAVPAGRTTGSGLSKMVESADYEGVAEGSTAVGIRNAAEVVRESRPPEHATEVPAKSRGTQLEMASPSCRSWTLIRVPQAFPLAYRTDMYAAIAILDLVQIEYARTEGGVGVPYKV